MEETKEQFHILVKVLEASDLPRQNMSTSVSVRVGLETRFTHIEKNNDVPYYNEFFVFDLNITYSSLMDTVITLAIFEHRKRLRPRKMIGCISLEVATVWAHQDHRIKKWIAVTLPSDKSTKLMGLIKTEIGVEAPESYTNQLQLSPMESPDVIGGVRARYILKFYSCIGLEVTISEKEPPAMFIKAMFAGTTRSTTKRQIRESIEWNEQITFIELFPPLFQKITLELCIAKKVLVSKIFYLSDIANISNSGYLPTYGPTYVHFYSDDCSYCTSLLMSIGIEYLTTYKYPETFHGTTLLPITPILSAEYGSIDNFLICGVLFDAMLMGKRYENNNITLNLCFGRAMKSSLESSCNISTQSYKALPGNSEFVYLPIKEIKPCVFMRSEWPNTKHRLSNSNIISKIVKDLSEVSLLAQELKSRDMLNEAKDLLKTELLNFKNVCKIISSLFSKGITPLDSERVNFIVRTLTELLIIIKNTDMNDLERLLNVTTKCIYVLNTICEDPQESFPNLIISLKQNKIVIGCKQLHPRHVIFSKIDYKNGNQCGRISSILLKNNEQNIIGRVDIWLWLGLWNQVSNCLQSLPPGHEDISNVTAIPITINYQTFEMYSVNCYIYRGQTVHGKSSDGLRDLFVRVYLSNQSRQTTTIRKSLVPFWKETLNFTEIPLYSQPEYVKMNPPSLTVEMWDQASKTAVLLDTALVLPDVRLQPLDDTKQRNVLWTYLGPSSKILAAFEIVQVTEQGGLTTGSIDKISSKFIDPINISYRLEVVFWGIRAVDTNGLKNISRPQVVMQWESVELTSDVLIRIDESPNFQHILHISQLELPETKLYAPPIVLRLLVSSKCIGCEVDPNVDRYIIELPKEEIWLDFSSHRKSMLFLAKSRKSTYKKPSMPDLIPLIEVDDTRSSSLRYEDRGLKSKLASYCSFFTIFSNCLVTLRYLLKIKTKAIIFEEDDEDEDEYDWWYRYFIGDVQTYTGELEAQPEFSGFTDVLKTFTIKQQQKNTSNPFVKIKAMVCLYKWPSEIQVVTKEGDDPEMGVLKPAKLSDRVKVLVRVYCVKAYDLHPADLNNKADPYIEIATPSSKVSDKANYIPKQLSPVFGKSYEVEATFPVDSILTVRVMDWDRYTMHDLIGETTIDVENRFYSEHRGTCGLSKIYSKAGCKTWRDVEQPQAILERLCNTYNLPLPQYYSKSVVIASKEFFIKDLKHNDEEKKEQLALTALRRWHEMPIVGHALVPEHVEIRSLYRSDRPGLVQGRLEMWCDIFDLSMGKIPAPLDITPRPPQSYELRVIIYNTEKVPLVDNSYFIGRKNTDIFVKGWLGDPKNAQNTDVHYTSVDGKGSFNWRFIFQFLYLRPEKRMVIYQTKFFEVGKTEVKIPASLHLQVWDKDLLSPDDFIGSLTMELCRMPKGAISVRTCKINNNITSSNSVDLFKVKRIRGWWPFQTNVQDEKKKSRSAGYLEAEFHLLTSDEAVASPAGLGRNEPASLPAPIRPEFKIRFWLAPLRLFMHFICGVHKGKMLFCLLVFGIFLFILIAIYSIPMFVVKKILGA